MTFEEAIQELSRIFKQALDNVGDCFQKIREHAEEEE